MSLSRNTRPECCFPGLGLGDEIRAAEGDLGWRDRPCLSGREVRARRALTALLFPLETRARELSPLRRKR